MVTTAPTTTAPPAVTERVPWAQVSVRTRLTAVIAVLTLVSLTGAGVLVWTLESARIEAGVSEQVDQEVEEFRVFEDEGVDPVTGTGFTDALRLVTVFLERNVPDDDEMLVAYEGLRPQSRTPNRYGESFLEDPQYLAAVGSLLDTGGTSRIDDATYGEVWVTAVPVRSATSDGGLVIINFLDDEHSELESTMRTYAVVAALSLGLVTLLAGLQSGRLLAPLRAVRDTASDITTSDLSRRIPERGNDDITALTRTFNGMLDRLEEGVEAQRRFLDDAGHELRTPLTVLRGHLELLDAADTEEVERTRAVLLEEVDRMSRLVGDLLVLAKSRRPDFLHPRATDVADLTVALFAKAGALGDRDWVLADEASGHVVVDEQRVTQAVLALADNAVKHTARGDRITIGSTWDGESLVLWVEDSGHGVRVEDRERIFERFGRADVGPGDEGFGLGLSIVAAIAEAHGGAVTVRDGAPRGARFELRLPADTRGDRWPAS
jgi:two-component system OmpR family sensor kinase